MIGLATIGNATIIAYDNKPVLSTDPWIGDEDSAYFGSWVLSHEIPKDYKRFLRMTKTNYFLFYDKNQIAFHKHCVLRMLLFVVRYFHI